MKSGPWIGGLVTGSVAGAAIGLLMRPRRSRNSWMRQGHRLWARNRKIWD